MLQFPTPFRLITNNSTVNGNSQLPTNAAEGFMVSEDLLRSLNRSLQRGNGKLLLQSNCEDVAVYMRNIACCKASFRCIGVDNEVKNLQASNIIKRIPKRTEKWIQLGGDRAQGFGWSSVPLLPDRGTTETEVAYKRTSTAIHRCLLEPHKM